MKVVQTKKNAPDVEHQGQFIEFDSVDVKLFVQQLLCRLNVIQHLRQLLSKLPIAISRFCHCPPAGFRQPWLAPSARH
jgi:hypothetical protein